MEKSSQLEKKIDRMPSQRTYSHVTSLSLSLLKSVSETACLETGQSEQATNQFRVSGLTVLRLFRCWAHVLQLAFSSRTPSAISVLRFVMRFQLSHTSLSSQS
jgi:hypothetical protein